jgi:dTDP-4-dehydrorhamnose 3,5-epimerase-like enzyme
MSNEPSLIGTGNFVDDRGNLLFLNELGDFEVKRLYIVENHSQGFIRAWHGHEFESKLFFVIQGAIKVGAVKLDDFTTPSRNQAVSEYVLSSNGSRALVIPQGYANGFKTLTHDAKLLILSDKTLLESKNDDYRFEFDHWDIWKSVYR